MFLPMLKFVYIRSNPFLIYIYFYFFFYFLFFFLFLLNCIIITQYNIIHLLGLYWAFQKVFALCWLLFFLFIVPLYSSSCNLYSIDLLVNNFFFLVGTFRLRHLKSNVLWNLTQIKTSNQISTKTNDVMGSKFTNLV